MKWICLVWVLTVNGHPAHLYQSPPLNTWAECDRYGSTYPAKTAAVRWTCVRR
jgi:hypothetical protein